MRPGPLVPVFFLASAAVFAFFIHLDFDREAFALGSQGSLEQVLGSSKEIIGDMMFLKADEYYHGGVIEKFHEAEGGEHQEGLIENKEEKDLHDKPGDWIALVNSCVQSFEHFHLSREKRKEMLPFFALSTQLDPHNIDAILATAYWLDTDFGKTQDAMGLLKKGILENPDAWQLEDELASLYFNREKNYAQSYEHYQKALEKAVGKDLHYFEWVRVYYHLAESSLKVQDKPGALTAYQKALEHLAGHEAPLEKKIRGKIKNLA